jgi:hypothetical protein
MGINFFSRLGAAYFSEAAAFPRYFRPVSGSGIYVILVPDSGWTQKFRAIYFGETEDFSQRITASHERYADWVREAGTAPLYFAQSWMHGSTQPTRAVLEQALRDCYQPTCNAAGYSLSSTLAANLPRSNAQQPSSLHALLAGLMSPTFGLFISHAWEYNEEYYRLEKLLNEDASFSWRNLSIPEHDAVEASPMLPKSYLDLVRVLENRISKSDCVLLLSGMYCAYSEWIQTEIQLADEHRKPVIGIRPRGQERVPQQVQRAAVEVVGWNTASIVSAVRRHASASAMGVTSDSESAYAQALGFGSSTAWGRRIL